jgi:hypothetical protein
VGRRRLSPRRLSVFHLLLLLLLSLYHLLRLLLMPLFHLLFASLICLLIRYSLVLLFLLLLELLPLLCLLLSQFLLLLLVFLICLRIARIRRSTPFRRRDVVGVSDIWAATVVVSRFRDLAAVLRRCAVVVSGLWDLATLLRRHTVIVSRLGDLATLLSRHAALRGRVLWRSSMHSASLSRGYRSATAKLARLDGCGYGWTSVIGSGAQFGIGPSSFNVLRLSGHGGNVAFASGSLFPSAGSR